ncbi:amidohydrolase family protein [Blastococcus sp. CT_GayMR20]|uniref:amidohydrolase family protein n=1 Tax=Blastococcus sp. CT_GayMR20 TaxID=2559609 RepID=UPI001FD807EF|nr:amidohydrolase family protein [Blastococcus sp. CT_GayMR20]
MAPIVDAHHHYWRTAAQDQSWRSDDHAALAKDFQWADLAPDLRRCGVDATVLVQSVDSPDENDRLWGYADEVPTVAGVVAWLPLRDPGYAFRELDRIRSLPRLGGVRCLVASDPLDWLYRDEHRAVLAEVASAGLTWDVVPVTEAQRRAVASVARALPDLRIAIGHLARPPVESGVLGSWGDQIAELAASPNIAVKLSLGIDVLTDWAKWNVATLRRYVSWALDCFGPDRAMIASNWPVVTLRKSYSHAWQDMASIVATSGLPEAALHHVLGATAARWYQLRV